MATPTLPNPDHRNHLTRRAALHGAAACGALALPAGAAVAAAEDLELLDLWREYIALWNGDDHSDQTRDRLSEIRTAITEARPESMLGLAVQTAFLEHDVDVGASDEQLVLLGAMSATLARLAGIEVPSNPDLSS